ncbi:PREDICTED: uncharacterized protein LOC104597970 isoform X1 [Nelumbo nucifera]|uniref:Uncharacterized protein LOC104597970 isoform X1 n=2 Tax=Nelumbo nucifera TaxID=4432 RepID=A0A1U8A0A2_NELNU|nr:PREDICTED: uncharacterized protein LOC104597970 isoform X1 [Nelumbo nucifera]XP_010258090.1 PREDICTED: uncharacterized protein LOC104597970 isoform X1 [Nelumbo nucifera]XP_010258092.1 PREDICTED: uncharacterized protein LOC104597970 isoform X1 [Nelumbo nucifera]XP_010258094.1 PREDICTED: uncharacterized protein LOC104597970 isoform X1 [Nelumbo nucifera]
MPGNEARDKVHNFFEQDNLSQGQQQFQVGGGNWTVLNNNLWAGHQRQIGSPPSSNSKNYNIQQSDPESGNNSQSLHVPLGTNLTQLTLRHDFAKAQSRSQQLSLNGVMHGNQGFHTRQNQEQFQGEDTVSGWHGLASRGVSLLESQESNAPAQSSAITRISERAGTAKAPINFDLLGGQLQLMRGQQPGMPQPQPRQQPGFNDMQLWQQQIMLKQLQELQRQQQLNEARQQNSMNHLSAKQTSADQLPTMVNGTQIHDPSNYLWTNELTGGETKVAPSTSQMFMAGTMNIVQRTGPPLQGFSNGLMFTNEQGQGLRSMGFIPQQLDQSLYGTPIASSRGNFSQYSNLQGISHDSADILTKAGGNQVEKTGVQTSTFSSSFQGDLFTGQGSMQDGIRVSKQGFQGKNLFGNFPIHGSSEGVSGNFQQLHSLPRVAPVQEFQGRQEQAGCSGNLQEKATTQAGPSQGFVALDPTEEKILFSTDDNICDGSFGRVTVGFGSPMEGSNCVNVFPSIQSGSWSALMQSAVAETSSGDTGMQDEWSGLNFQKTELSAGNQPGAFNNSEKQQSWVDNNLQAASSLTSRPFPLFDDANVSPSSRNISVFQQSSIKFPFEQTERMRLDSSRESIQQSPKEGSKWLDRSPHQRSLAEGSQQIQPLMHLENSSGGAWAGHLYSQSESAAHSAGAELNGQTMQDSWSHQQSISSYNIGGHPFNKSNGWNINESLSTSRDTTLKIRENENIAQNYQGNDSKKAMQSERDTSGDIWKADGNPVAISFPNLTGGPEQSKSGACIQQVNQGDSHTNNFTAIPNSTIGKSNREVDQHVLNSHQFDYGKPTINSSPRYKGNETGGNYQQSLNKIPCVSEPLMNNSDRVSGESYEKNRENCHQKEISNNSSQSQHPVAGGSVRENVWLSSSDSHSSAGVNQKLSGPAGRKAPSLRRFQYHPMGNLGINMEPADSMKNVTHSQVLSQQVTRGLKSHEQGYFGQSKFASHIPNNAIDTEKGQLPDFQGNIKRPDDVPSRGILPGYAANASSSFDRSTVFYAPNRNAQTSQNMLELLHKVDQSREHNAMMPLNSSDCSPSAEMPKAEASDKSISHLRSNQSSTSQGFGLRLAPPSQRLPVANHAFSPQNSSQTVNDFNSKHADSEMGEKGQARLAPTTAVQSLPLSHEINQRENWDNQSSVSGQPSNETSHLNMQENFSKAFTSLPYPRNLQNQQMSGASGQAVKDQSVNVSFDRLASHFTQADASHDGMVSDLSARSSGSGAVSRVSPFNLAPPADTSQPLRVSGQQVPFPEALPVSQPSITSNMSQQGSFSTMLHNAWNQRSSGGQSHKVSPNVFQSNPSNSNLETSSWTSQKPGQQDTKRGGYSSSEFGTCSSTSQRFSHVEDQPRKESPWKQITSDKVGLAQQTAPVSQGPESKAKQLSDAKSLASGSLFSHPHQQEVDRGRNGKDPVLVSQADNAPLQNPAALNKDIEAFGRSLKASHMLHQNYSLLHQMQAMKGVETDPSMRVVKRLKGADYGADAQQAASKSGQQLLYGYNPVFRDPVDNELNSAARRNSFSGDTKMLSFSSEARDDQNNNTSSQSASSHDIVTFGRNDSQSHSNNLNIASTKREHSQISPQMAPSWFDQYGTFKNGQMLPMYDAWKTAKTAAQQFFFGKPSESLPTHASTEQVSMVDSSQVGSIWQSTTTTLVASKHLSPQIVLPDASDQSLAVVRPKKRKSVTLELQSWQKEVTQGSHRLQNTSICELDWAQAANRLIEKVEDEAEMIEDGQPMVRPRRRLILTTQLLQQLLRPAPAALLSADVTLNYESVTYYVARLALGDACSLISSSGSDSRSPPDKANTISEKVKNSERIGDQYFSKAVEGFIGRARKLENDLFRLDKRASILDLRVDCQDMERFSVINRFAKFHGRSHADGAETSSSSDAASTAQKTFPQRYVTAHPMPRNLPEGVQCLSL